MLADSKHGCAVIVESKKGGLQQETPCRAMCGVSLCVVCSFVSVVVGLGWSLSRCIQYSRRGFAAVM